MVAAAFALTDCSTAIYTVALPNSNICAFGRGVVLAYMDHFRRLALRTKMEGILIELGESSVHKSLVSFASHVTLARKRREECGTFNPYNTARPRRCWFYEEFGLFKMSKLGSMEERERPFSNEWQLMRQPLS